MSLPSSADAIVVGAGLAGASTAWWLARAGVGRILIVEQEELPGMHSSGRNAALARQAAAPAALVPLLVEGTRFLAAPPEGFAHRPLLEATGSLLLVDREDEAPPLEAARNVLGTLGVAADWVSPVEAVRRVAFLAGAPFARALFTPSDGVADVAALLDGFLRGAAAGGAQLVVGRMVERIESDAGRVVGVVIGGERVATPIVVNAAGAWAGPVARLAGATPVPLAPTRRHLFVSAPRPGLDRRIPWVWHVGRGWYARPEAPGLLLSACDQTEMAPGDPPEDPTVRDLLAAKLSAGAPALADLGIARSWAGMRTLTPDGAFALGGDPRLAGFVWAAGLGGHGMTSAAAVGRWAAEAAQGRAVPVDHDVARFSV